MPLFRLLRTVRHLKPAQVQGRLVERLPHPRPRLSPAPAPRSFPGPWTAPIPREPSLIGPASARFLNEDGGFEAAADWNHPGRARLWLYNLHYFDELAAADDDGARTPWRRAMVERWIAENPPGHGAGWEPYPLSLRIANWIKWALAGAEIPPAWRDSLAVQTRWLEDRLEWRLLGNHLLANAKALIFAGLYFQGPEAGRWLARGLSLYDRQLAEQVLADGGHFERSPLYHAIVLEDLLDVINLARASGVVDAELIAGWAGVAERMLAWLAAMVHPDGQISFFNDAAFGVAAEPEALEAYAARLGIASPAPPAAGAVRLSPSGYVRLARGEAVAIIDAAPVGPDYQPGHAHADTLSFELSLGRERIVVNGGTSDYGDGAQRQRERSTAAHSTVEIDGRSSSEVWAGFRVGRRARVRDVEMIEDGDALTVGAAHDGYAWRPGRPIHRRSWRLRTGGMTIVDAIEGRCASAVARFHLGPGVLGRADDDGLAGEWRTPSGRIIRWKSSQPARLEPSQWRPQFGLRLEAHQLVVPLTRSPLRTELSW